MHFKDLIQQRYSVRKYSSKKVSRELIAQIIEAGQYAPSACNKQPWRFVVVDEEPLLSQVHGVYRREWFKSAPVVIIAYANYEEGWVRSFDNKNHCDIDVAIAVDHMTLLAAELGLGTCWICHFDPEMLASTIQTEEAWQPVAILSLGYSEEEGQLKKKRKTTEAIVRYNSW